MEHFPNMLATRGKSITEVKTTTWTHTALLVLQDEPLKTNIHGNSEFQRNCTYLNQKWASFVRSLKNEVTKRSSSYDKRKKNIMHPEANCLTNSKIPSYKLWHGVGHVVLRADQNMQSTV